ncbi:MAG: hypothetical protein ACM3XO_01490 [Bacteroidota bacterium]
MPNIETVIGEINKNLVQEFEKKLRTYLVGQEKDWLVEQIIRLALDAHSLEERDRKQFREGESRKRQARSERLKNLRLEPNLLREFVKRYKEYSRERCIQEDLLSQDAPAKGTEWISSEFRSTEGNKLLQLAKDVLFGLLFGEESTNTHLRRNQRQLLTLTLPRTKSEALDFMKATTEFHARGTWQDPESGAGEVQSDNVVFEVEYGESEDQAIGEGIITALRLINNLEINEKVLYGRLQKIEQSTLVS